ncbi:SDR family oxidoreductase [uncultured Sunxiuqinia sp.]|uniref:SDR family oxidoreductase n=1 Tax=uncultured Sunxiuqinia sp. TaxID=1573825 RepID=UPI002AA76FA3|nr:SDR family oxidoreductase [uncultured Sunxiuqinia sp.]
MVKEKVLLAGATGYLGRFITQELIDGDYETKIVVRNKEKVKLKAPHLEIIEAQVTNPDSLKDICKNVDIVISSVGITRQKDGLTYMDVDYQANVNLINEAKKSGVKKFIYISVLNGEKLRNLKICDAKEKLGDYLKTSGLNYCIIRPNGFFSDMADFLKMAKGGRVYLFGDGKLKLNPIHGKDLAKEVVNAINQEKKEINIGGPDLLSQNEIAELALKAYGNKIRIVHLPDWIRKFALWSVRTFTSSKTYGPIEFFMTTMVMDMTAPLFGEEKLEIFFNNKARK